MFLVFLHYTTLLHGSFFSAKKIDTNKIFEAIVQYLIWQKKRWPKAQKKLNNITLPLCKIIVCLLFHAMDSACRGLPVAVTVSMREKKAWEDFADRTVLSLLNSLKSGCEGSNRIFFPPNLGLIYTQTRRYGIWVFGNLALQEILILIIISIPSGFGGTLFTVMMVMLDIAVLLFYSCYVGEILTPPPPTNIKYNNRKIIKMSHARCVVLSMVLTQLLDMAILLTLLCVNLWKCIAFTELKSRCNLL